MIGIRSWAKEHEAIATLLLAVITIGAALIAALKFAFAPPVLALSVRTHELFLPGSLYDRFSIALETDSAGLSDSTKATLGFVRDFLRTTESFTVITVRNNSDRSLQNVDVRFRYVHSIDGWAVAGDGVDEAERAQLLTLIAHDPSNGLLTVKSIPRVPPKSTLNFYIWGDVSFAALFGEDRLTATFDGGAGEVITERTIRGLDAFIYDNAGLLVVVLLLLNVAIWNTAFSRRGDQSHNGTTVPLPTPTDPPP